MRLGLITLALVFAASCASQSSSGATDVPVATPPPPAIEADWNGLPQGAEWSALTSAAIDEVGLGLLTAVPGDITAFCPGYAALDATGRRAFWVGLISAMARFESTFDPRVSFDEYAHCTNDDCRADMTTQDGRHVISRGLLQLSQESANYYASRGCRVPIADEERLHEPALNLRCAVVIMHRWVTADGVISSANNRGGARYWSVLRPTSDRLVRIQAYTAQTRQCRAP